MLASSFPETDTARALVRLFERWTGVEPQVTEQRERGRADAVIELGPHVFMVEIKSDASPTSIEGALAHLRKQSTDGGVPLVVVPFMTGAGAERCAAEGIGWIDLSGNAHVTSRTPKGDLFVHVAGLSNAFETRGRPRNAFAPKSARLARTLLASPGVSWTQKALAEATDLDAGHVSRLIKRLLSADLVARDDEGLVAVSDPRRLLDAWADGNAYRHEIIEGHLPGRFGEERAHRLVDALRQHGVSHALTGLAAAWAYTKAAGFRLVACYVSPEETASVREALTATGFREETRAANVQLLLPDDAGVFDGARVIQGLRCVTPAQSYVDLAHAPERAAELQDALRPLALRPPDPHAASS